MNNYKHLHDYIQRHNQNHYAYDYNYYDNTYDTNGYIYGDINVGNLN